MRGRYVIAAAAAAMLVWTAAALAIVSTGESKKADVAVPRVLGLRGAEAATKLERMGLEVYAEEHLGPSESSSTGLSLTTGQSLAGVVVAQSPSAGVSVRRGSTVELSVSRNPAGY
jgi:beta-lactam-binding protein with PASTA domain